MKILITGGTGFIGRNLLEQLKNKFECFAPLSSMLNLLEEDKVSLYLKDNLFDVIIHTATWNATMNSKKNLTKILRNNLRMFFNLARCSSYYGKMIYYGSGAEYDRRHWLPKMDEDYFDKHVPEDEYGFSKYIMSKFAEQSQNIYNLRLFGVFGKYEDWEIRFISNACCKVIHDLPITIKQNVFFDYIYIDDLIKITKWFIENKPREKIFNVCTSRIYDLLTLAKKVLEVAGKDLEITLKNNGMEKEYSGDNSRLLKGIGKYIFSDMGNCISELYQWYLDRKGSIERRKLLIDK